MKKYWIALVTYQLVDSIGHHSSETFEAKVKKTDSPDKLMEICFENMRIIKKKLRSNIEVINVNGDFAKELERELNGYLEFVSHAIEQAMVNCGYKKGDNIPISMETLYPIMQEYDRLTIEWGKRHQKLHHGNVSLTTGHDVEA